MQELIECTDGDGAFTVHEEDTIISQVCERRVYTAAVQHRASASK